jgi:hypothetical protein
LNKTYERQKCRSQHRYNFTLISWTEKITKRVTVRAQRSEMELMDKVDITEEFVDWLYEQEPERLALAQLRAEKRDTEFWDDDSLLDIIVDELKTMYVSDAMRILVNSGELEARINDDGELIYFEIEDEDDDLDQ